MKKQTPVSRFLIWLNNIHIEDPVNRQIAGLLQIMLMGIIFIFVLATFVTPFLPAPTPPFLASVIRMLIGSLIFGTPLFLLRRGYYRASVMIILALLILLMSYAVFTTHLRDIAETLTFFTLAILLAGLLSGRSTLIFTFTISVGIVLSSAFQDPDSARRADEIVIALNFILLNGLMAIFINSFGITLRSALRSSLKREEELRKEVKTRQSIEGDLKNALGREQQLNEVTSAISSKLDLDTILSTVVQLAAELVEADSGAISLINTDGQSISHYNLFNLPTGLGLDKPVPKGRGLSWHVIETRQSALLENYSDFEGSLPNWEATNLHSLIEVPLTVGDNCLGTLSVAKRDLSFRFSDRDLALVESIGRQTAIAIQNARLFDAQQHELNERIRIEKEREELIRKLEDQNEELTRFTYTVSHDLRSPLVTIKGFLGMLNRDLQDNHHDKIQNDFERIAGATDKMEALLKDLLELSRIGRIINPPVEIDTARLIQDALDSVDGRIRSKNITVKIAPKLPKLYGDRIRLREVFENLIDNAAKYMGDQTNPVIDIGVRNQADEQVIYVNDNGMGIEEKFQTKIFGLFEKLDPAIEGTGIGLALVKRIIETHGGKIWAESDGLGKGSTFCFTVPDNPN